MASISAFGSPPQSLTSSTLVKVSSTACRRFRATDFSVFHHPVNSNLLNLSLFQKCCRPSLPQSVWKPGRLYCSSSSGGSYPFVFDLWNGNVVDNRPTERRRILIASVGLLAGALMNTSIDGVAAAAEFADMPALKGKDYGKTKMRYPDYTETESGLQYKDLRPGTGPSPKMGETVVVDWDGYTIGYYGRIFEARNKTKGGSFEGDDKDYFKFRLGSNEVIPAFEEAVSGMALGGVRSDAGL